MTATVTDNGSYFDCRGAFIPSPDEIRDRCREFQAGWTNLEARRRAGLQGIPEDVITREIACREIVRD